MRSKKWNLFCVGVAFLTCILITLRPTFSNTSNANSKRSNYLISQKFMKHKFVLCADNCQEADFYVAYGRENQVTLAQKTAKYFNTKLKVLPGIKDALNGKVDMNEQIVDNEDGNVVNSLHRIARVQIGNLLKSENINVLTSEANSMAQAKVKLAWGDLLTITSKKFSKGTPVKIQLSRTYGGYAAIVTDNAYYKVVSKTYVNGESLPFLEYTLQKDAGPGNKDISTGKDKASQVIEARVGDFISLEGWLEVLDGVKGKSSTAKEKETLIGADSTKYSISLVNADQNACLKSASGVFSAGNCN